MRIGIVGLPNAGKSTLFNALSRSGAETAAYAFTTIEPNQAVVPIPDLRLDRFAEVFNASKTIHETITFVDIAGLVRGAHKGEGLGNKFLANIRETDAIVHVVRCFEDRQVVHPHGEVDPVADLETVETELILADLEQAERRHKRVARDAKSGERESIAEAAWLEELVGALSGARPATAVAPPADLPDAQRKLGSITANPVLYVANVADDSVTADVGEVAPSVAEYAKQRGAGAVAISARLEAELAELDDVEAAEMRADLDAGASGLDRVISGAFRLLDLIVFYTGDAGRDAMARSITRGSTAYDAAGKIHTDFQKGFVRAEVVPVESLIELGSYAAARESGAQRVEGRDYLIQDGDTLTIKFTP